MAAPPSTPGSSCPPPILRTTTPTKFSSSALGLRCSAATIIMPQVYSGVSVCLLRLPMLDTWYAHQRLPHQESTSRFPQMSGINFTTPEEACAFVQGEERAALNRASFNSAPELKLGPSDLILFSAKVCIRRAPPCLTCTHKSQMFLHAV